MYDPLHPSHCLLPQHLCSPRTNGHINTIFPQATALLNKEHAGRLFHIQYPTVRILYSYWFYKISVHTPNLPVPYIRSLHIFCLFEHPCFWFFVFVILFFVCDYLDCMFNCISHATKTDSLYVLFLAITMVRIPICAGYCMKREGKRQAAKGSREKCHTRLKSISKIIKS